MGGVAALVPEPVWGALLLVAAAAGIGYYGYSSHRIGSHFGMVSVPYAGIYAALLVTALAPGVSNVDRPAAVIMSLVSWGLYTRTVTGARAVRLHPRVRGAAVAVGFFALVLIPLFSPPALATTVNFLYRLAAVVGWVAGARPGIGPKKGP